jgi:hypothetical protein
MGRAPERDNRVIASANAESSTLDCIAVLALPYEISPINPLLIHSEKNGRYSLAGKENNASI